MTFQRTLVVLFGSDSPAGRGTQLRDPLVQDQAFGLPFPASQQHGERLLVEADGIVIGVGRAGAIAGRAQIARTFRLARAQTEMMSEQDEVFEPLGLVAVEPLQRGTNPSMELDPALQEQVLIDHVLKHGLRKAIGSQRDRVRARSRAGQRSL